MEVHGLKVQWRTFPLQLLILVNVELQQLLIAVGGGSPPGI